MKTLLNNIERIIVIAVISLRAIIALPLSFAAVHHFNFLEAESKWVVYLVAYISIFAVEVLMTLFSLLSASFRRAKLETAYYTSLAFVALFFLLNAWLLWEMKSVYPSANTISLLVWQVLNMASVALSESLGFITSEKVEKSIVIKEAAGQLPAAVVEIKADQQLTTADKARRLWDTGYFKTQTELARYLVCSQAFISASLRG